MKKIYYTSPFVPAEWITAHGLQPVKIQPGLSSSHQQFDGLPGICAYAKRYAGDIINVSDAAAVIFATTCDQMRRVYELVKEAVTFPVFLINIPSTWQSTAAANLYNSELKRLGRFLADISGQDASQDLLAEIMVRYNDERQQLRQSEAFLSGRDFSTAVTEYHYKGKLPITDGGVHIPAGPAIALFGGAIMPQEGYLFDLVEDTGGHIALDATASGIRMLPRRFNLRLLENDPLAELADAYFGNLPDAFRRPNSELYLWLKNEIASRDIKGIIFHRYLWCDIWHAEVKRMKEWLDISVLDLDSNDNDCINRERIKTRVQAFVEMLL